MSRSNYDMPFYVDIGTSIAAVRCASNREVVVRLDNSHSGDWAIREANRICTLLNREACAWNRIAQPYEMCRKCWEDPDGGEVFGSGVNEDCPWYGEPDGCNNRSLRAEAFELFEKEEEAKEDGRQDKEGGNG